MKQSVKQQNSKSCVDHDRESRSPNIVRTHVCLHMYVFDVCICGCIETGMYKVVEREWSRRRIKNICTNNGMNVPCTFSTPIIRALHFGRVDSTKVAMICHVTKLY